MTTEDPSALLQEAYDRDPRKFPFGVFSYDDGSPAHGGGVGAFFWFPDALEAARVLTQANFAAPVRIQNASHEIVSAIESAKRLMDTVVSGESSFSEVIPKLNDQLASLVQLQWADTFDELRTGDDEFARVVRSHFRTEHGGSEGDGPIINSGEIDGFVRYLGTYGM